MAKALVCVLGILTASSAFALDAGDFDEVEGYTVITTTQVDGEFHGAEHEVAKKARLMTDETPVYNKIGKEFTSHEKVNHSSGEYSRGDVTTNTVESSFAILKRGLYGTFHHVSEAHLQRYANEFDFRWNTRAKLGFSDTDRAIVALKNIGGKRLTYRRIDA